MIDTYFSRLLEERAALAEKCVNLTIFLGSETFDQLSSEKKSLLKLQLRTMETYLDILNMRIAGEIAK